MAIPRKSNSCDYTEKIFDEADILCILLSFQKNQKPNTRTLCILPLPEISGQEKQP